MGRILREMAISQCRLPARAALLLLVGVLVSFEAKEGEFVAFIDEGAGEMALDAIREPLAAKEAQEEVEKKPPLACSIRKKQAETKLIEMENQLKALGVEMLTKRKKIRDLKTEAENGDADFAGRKKAKADYPAKFHRLLFKVKQKLLSRSPAVGMAKQMQATTDKLKHAVLMKTAMKWRLGNQTQAMEETIARLKIKATSVARRTKILKATLDKRTKSYEAKFRTEIEGLATAKKTLEMKMEVSEKKRQFGLNARRSELIHKTKVKKADMIMLQPKVDHYEDLAQDAQEQLADLQKRKAEKEGEMQAKISNIDKDLANEQADKDRIAKKQAAERQQKKHIMQLKSRGQKQEIGDEAEVEEKHVAKQNSIRQAEAVATLRARTLELKDAIKSLERGADIREAAIQYKMIKDKAQAERDGIGAIEAYKKSLSDKRSEKAKSAASNALDVIENLDSGGTDTNDLKKTLDQLKKDSKDATKGHDESDGSTDDDTEP